MVRRDGQTVAGGGFLYLDEETAEIKRVWTFPDHRRQGLSRTVMTALEDTASCQRAAVAATHRWRDPRRRA
nr:GNAT family N-acetyltransferase [Corynebacterium sp.]